MPDENTRNPGPPGKRENARRNTRGERDHGGDHDRAGRRHGSAPPILAWPGAERCDRSRGLSLPSTALHAARLSLNTETDKVGAAADMAAVCDSACGWLWLLAVLRAKTTQCGAFMTACLVPTGRHVYKHYAKLIVFPLSRVGSSRGNPRVSYTHLEYVVFQCVPNQRLLEYATDSLCENTCI